MSEFDLVVIGAGPGGYPAAIRAAQKGKKVALIESNKLGGTCLNRGCIPSKALIACADSYRHVLSAKKYGINVQGISFDYKKMVEHKNQTVQRMLQGLEYLISQNNIEVIHGHAKYVSANTIKVLGENPVTLKTKNSIIAAGSEPYEIDKFPFDFVDIHNSSSILQMEELPKSLAIIGAGYIGCEFASLYATLGVKVILIEALAHILPFQDKDISQRITQSFKEKNIDIYTSSLVKGVKKESGKVKIDLGDVVVEAEKALISVGRMLNCKDLGLEKIAVQLDERGKIKVNCKMETSIASIYAIGDVVSNYQLAHVATHQGLVAVENILGKETSMHYNAIPSVIFTDPEVASVGYSLQEAVDKGYAASESQFNTAVLGIAQAAQKQEGFFKVVIDRQTKAILGAQVVGYQAGILIAQMALAIENELTLECVIETICAHPTFSEGWLEACFIAHGTPLHMPPKKRMIK
jgi:dihydrolipoamide dehydrogenase